MDDEIKRKYDSYLLMNDEERMRNKVIIIDLNDDNYVDETIYNYKLNDRAKKVLKSFIKELLRKEEGRI